MLANKLTTVSKCETAYLGQEILKKTNGILLLYIFTNRITNNLPEANLGVVIHEGYQRNIVTC